MAGPRPPAVEDEQAVVPVPSLAPRAPETWGRVAPSRAGRRRGLLLLLGLLAVGLLASVAVGARLLSVGEVWDALRGVGTAEAEAIVQSIRLPRTALALIVGGALGVAGALIQGHTRNPLADPGLLGVSAGAAFAVVLALSTGVISGLAGSVPVAMVGALVASVVVFVIGSSGRAGATPLTLALAGAAVTALLEAVISAMVLLDVGTLYSYRLWVVGTLEGRGSDVVWTVLPFVVAGLVLAVVNTRSLNSLSLGDDVARSLGVHVGRSRAVGVVAVTILAGAAVAACGPIAFVGLVVPHAMRAFTGPDYRWLVPYSALAGAVLLLAADVVGRVVARPAELQVGIVMALVGAPVFIAIVRRRRMVSV